MINKKRLIITSIISILLVSTLFLGSTYSIFTSQDIDEDVHVYKTGDLEIDYLSNDIKMTNVTPMTVEEANAVTPHRITVTNNGNVAYQFDLILSNTPDSITIDYQYIMIKVGELEPKKLSDCTNNIIKEDIILLPGNSVDIDVRVWVAKDIANSEMGKTFNSKLSIDGLAVYNDNTEIDNSILASSIIYLNTVEPGSYVKYVGVGVEGNQCDNTTTVNGWTSCGGKNANYVSDTNKGYCLSESYGFNSNGWRIGYIEDDSAYLVSAGSTDCMCTSSNGEASSSCSGYVGADNLYMHFDNLDNIALKYCNGDYAKGGVCDNTTTWAMDATDFSKITEGYLELCNNSSNAVCGLNNDLIDNGGLYWYATSYNSTYNAYAWNGTSHMVSYINSTYANGVRPVIALDPNVRIVGGTGTYEDPYLIAN